MKVTLVSHASVLIETSDAVIWTDPWIKGKVFNESWALLPEPQDASIDEALAKSGFIWISHEHPDHFNFPSLKFLPDVVKQRVTILFQYFPTKKMVEAFKKLGFTKIVTIGHRKTLQISKETSVYLYQAAPLDSALGVITTAGHVLLNVNDCELSTYDYVRLKKDLPPVTVLLNQFSYATYTGRDDVEKALPLQAQRILRKASDAHRMLDAKYTLPMASLMYFCATDNEYLNKYANTVVDFHEHFSKEGLSTAILFPGQKFLLDEPLENSSALTQYQSLYAVPLKYYETETIPFEEIRLASSKFFSDIGSCYPRFIFHIIGKIIVYIKDHDAFYLWDFKSFTLSELPRQKEGWDLEVRSQPFLFVLKNRFGLQTLTISGRYTIKKKFKKFLFLRILLGLWNSEIYFKFKKSTEKTSMTFYITNWYRYFRQGISMVRSII